MEENDFLGGRLLPAWSNSEECGGGGRGSCEKGHRASPLCPWRSIHPINRPHCPLFSKVILILGNALKTSDAVSLQHLQATQPHKNAHPSSLDLSKEVYDWD